MMLLLLCLVLIPLWNGRFSLFFVPLEECLFSTGAGGTLGVSVFIFLLVVVFIAVFVTVPY